MPDSDSKHCCSVRVDGVPNSTHLALRHHQRLLGQLNYLELHVRRNPVIVFITPDWVGLATLRGSMLLRGAEVSLAPVDRGWMRSRKHKEKRKGGRLLYIIPALLTQESDLCEPFGYLVSAKF